MLERDGRFLLVRRAVGLVNASAWCFPGGRLEEGETGREAIRRELVEELGLHVEPVAELGTVRLPGSSWELSVWTVREVGGTLALQPDEVDAAEWMTPEQVRALEGGMLSNLEVLALLDAQR